MEAKNPARGRGPDRNRQAALNLLRESGGLSRVELAARLGLTRAAVTLLIGGMLEEGLVEEYGEYLPQGKKPKRGRRRVLLSINGNCRLAFGAAIEKSWLTVGLSNLRGETLDRLRLQPREDYREMLGQIVESVKKLIRANCIPSGKLLGIGVALAASGRDRVEGETEAARLSRLKRDLSHALTFPVTAAPLAEGAALAQLLFAEAPGHFLLIRQGGPSEAAVICGGRPYRGASGKAGGIRAAAAAPSLAEEVGRAVAVLDPARLYVMGGSWETEEGLAELAGLLPTGPAPEHAAVTEPRIHLCGCAAAVAEFFYG